MSNVANFAGETTQDIDVDKMLDANKGEFDTLIFMGRDKDGVFQCGSSIGDVGEMLVLIELFKRELLERVE